MPKLLGEFGEKIVIVLQISTFLARVSSVLSICSVLLSNTLHNMFFVESPKQKSKTSSGCSELLLPPECETGA